MAVRMTNSAQRRNPELRKREIINATIQSISEIGYNDVTVNTICAAAGISRGLIGHYFNGKDALLLEAVKHVATEIGEVTRAAAAAAGEDPVKRLYATARASFSMPAFSKPNVCVWVALAGNAAWCPELSVLYHELWSGYRNGLKGLFERAAKARGIELDGALAAFTFTRLVEGLWVGWAADSDEISPSRAEAACITYLDAIFNQ